LDFGDYLHHPYSLYQKAGKPRDNAVIELFFRRFKDVLCSHFHYWKCDDLQKVIDETVHYFNYIKPMQKLKRKPPVQYRPEQAA